MNRAVFLDRDGVLIAEKTAITGAADVHILDGVPRALSALSAAGFRLIVISNQTVVARGLLRPDEVRVLEEYIEDSLAAEGAPPLDGFFFCPHHPNATVPVYRTSCACRKPRPGLLFAASAAHAIDLATSYFVGDRPTDVAAGHRAGCRTILVESGAHAAAPIETVEPLEAVAPDYVCADLAAAAAWILGGA